MTFNSFLSSTDISNLKPQMIVCDYVIQSIFSSLGIACIRTSVGDKVHSARSLHKPGYAVDYRTKHINGISDKLKLVDVVKDSCPWCDVILEHVGEDQEHMHVEYDPKNDKVFQANKARYRAYEIEEW